MEKQKHSETKSKMTAEADTLKSITSQNTLEKRALQHHFEKAMQRVMYFEKEVKQLKIRQEQDARERDAFCNKIEQLEKELSQARSDHEKELNQARSDLDAERKKTAKEKDRADQLESGSIIPTPVFHKVLNEFY